MKAKRCFICQKELPIENGEVCQECRDFFKWKYNGEFEQILQLHKEVIELEEKLNSIKSRRKK